MLIVKNLYPLNSKPSVKKEILILIMQYYICLKKTALQKKNDKQ